MRICDRRPKFQILMGCRPCLPPCHSAPRPSWRSTPSKFPSICSALSTGLNRLKLSRRRARIVNRLPAKLHLIWNSLKFDAVDAIRCSRCDSVQQMRFDAVDGVDAVDASDAVDAVDASDAVDGVDGVDAADAVDAVDAFDAVDGVDGVDAVDGVD